MKFGTHILPTYMSETDGRLADFYRRTFEQIIEVEKLGFDQAWVTEHHFGCYGGPLPHPPIWVGATHSEETFRWAGEMDYDLMTVPFVHPTTDALHELVKVYRRGLAARGHDFVGREVLGKFHIYVSDSFERGMREAVPFMKNYTDLHQAADPERRLTEHDIGSDMARGFIIVGDPERCSDTIRRWHEEGGITTFSGTFHFGGMPQEMALKIFACLPNG
jgi:alkanesulfonate monooxygenase SsuD/methylene tetrahydromethanopterin reductase-like flavin-dependent oxidoreductase (luciferase family)